MKLLISIFIILPCFCFSQGLVEVCKNKEGKIQDFLRIIKSTQTVFNLPNSLIVTKSSNCECKGFKNLMCIELLNEEIQIHLRSESELNQKLKVFL